MVGGMVGAPVGNDFERADGVSSLVTPESPLGRGGPRKPADFAKLDMAGARGAASGEDRGAIADAGAADRAVEGAFSALLGAFGSSRSPRCRSSAGSMACRIVCRKL